MVVFDNESQIVIIRKVGEFVGDDGIKRFRIRREIADAPIKLGSIMNKKNQDILEIRCEAKQKNIFEGLFGGGFK